MDFAVAILAKKQCIIERLFFLQLVSSLRNHQDEFSAKQHSFVRVSVEAAAFCKKRRKNFWYAGAGNLKKPLADIKKSFSF
jgi:hypothetical protein